MKKTVLLISVCLSSIYSGAQSTCETRVDAHPKATTLQRVNYCLTPEQVAPVPRAGENLIFSGISSRTVSQTQKNPARSSARKGAFSPERVEVVQNLVPTQSFPKFTNEQLSEQEKLARQKALEEERAKIEEALAKADLKPQEHTMQADYETQSGLKARQKKPGRRFLQKPQVLEKQPLPSVTADAEPLEEVALAAQEYSYNQSALPAEVSSYTPYAPADETPVSAYEPYAPASGTADQYAPAATETVPAQTASYAPAD